MASFRVLQYNILAQTLARSSYFPYCERCVGTVAGGAGATGEDAPPSKSAFSRFGRHFIGWHHRREHLARVIASADADILCFCEVDSYVRDPSSGASGTPFMRAWLDQNGFDSLYRIRTKGKADGTLIAWRRSRFRLLQSAAVALDDAGDAVALAHREGRLADRFARRPTPFESDPSPRFLFDYFECAGVVALVALEAIDPSLRPAETAAPSPSASASSTASSSSLESIVPGVVVAATHLFWDPKFADVKETQAETAKLAISEFCASLPHGTSSTSGIRSTPPRAWPVIFAGDFNSTPVSETYLALRNPLPLAAVASAQAAAPEAVLVDDWNIGFTGSCLIADALVPPAVFPPEDITSTALGTPASTTPYSGATPVADDGEAAASSSSTSSSSTSSSSTPSSSPFPFTNYYLPASLPCADPAARTSWLRRLFNHLDTASGDPLRTFLGPAPAEAEAVATASASTPATAVAALRSAMDEAGSRSAWVPPLPTAFSPALEADRADALRTVTERDMPVLQAEVLRAVGAARPRRSDGKPKGGARRSARGGEEAGGGGGGGGGSGEGEEEEVVLVDGVSATEVDCSVPRRHWQAPQRRSEPLESWEPQFTTWVGRFNGAIDFVLYHPAIALAGSVAGPRIDFVAACALPDRDWACAGTVGMPCATQPSDHLPNAVDFRFVRGESAAV